jgi:D-sedoheptulose 7-phosphate isomerase
MGHSVSSYTSSYLSEVEWITSRLDRDRIDQMVDVLAATRDRGGRLFVLGVGGSAGNASHAVNDFRKIAGIESYAPTDNVSELTARINDDGWESSFANWLSDSKLGPRDTVLVFSVGGGNPEKNISLNIVAALKMAKNVKAQILGIVGRDGGYTARTADVCLIIPTAAAETVTPHTEAFQSVVWHLIVSHPRLREREMKWERTA